MPSTTEIRNTAAAIFLESVPLQHITRNVHQSSSVAIIKNKRDSVAADEETAGSHGGSDPNIVAEFIRHLQQDGPIANSPVAARYAVAAGFLAAQSLRSGNVPLEVPRLPEEVVEYFRAEVEGRQS